MRLNLITPKAAVAVSRQLVINERIYFSVNYLTAI